MGRREGKEEKSVKKGGKEKGSGGESKDEATRKEVGSGLVTGHEDVVSGLVGGTRDRLPQTEGETRPRGSSHAGSLQDQPRLRDHGVWGLTCESQTLS